MSGASKLRAILNLIIIIVGIVMIVLHIITIANIGSMGDSLTELENLMYSLRTKL